MKRQLVQILFVNVLMLLPLAGALAVSPVQKTPTETAQPPAVDTMHAQEMDKAYHEQLGNVRLMIGHISLALMALEHGDGMLDVAGSDVDEALKLAQALEKSAPIFKSKDTMRFGKLTHEEESVTKLFYIPIVDESFMLRGFDVRGGKSEKIRETDARMVHAHVSLDIRKAISGLTDTKAALEKKDAKAAENALTGILSAAVADEVVANEPLHVAHDNLVLAENLLREKRYDAARFALKYAHKGFEDYASRTHDPAQKQHAKGMQKDIDALSEQLRKEDPTTLQRAGDTVKGWGAKVKKWLANHPVPEPGHKLEPRR